MGARAYIRPRLGRRGQDSLSPAPPSQEGAGLKFWFRADMGITIASAQNVSGWKDQSSSALQMNTAANYPQLSASEINGKPAVVFSATPTILNRASGSATISVPFSEVWIIRPTLAPSASLTALSNGVDDNRVWSRDGGTQIRFARFGGQTSNYSAAYADAFECWAFASDGSYIRRNGVNIGQSAGGNAGGTFAASTSLDVAGAFRLAECFSVVGYATALRYAAYIKQRYGLTL